MLRVRRVACQFERQIGFYGCIDLRRTADVNIPAAVFELPSPDVLRKFHDAFPVETAQDVKIKDVIGLERRVRLQFTRRPVKEHHGHSHLDLAAQI